MRNLRFQCYVECMLEKINTFKYLVRNPEIRNQLRYLAFNGENIEVDIDETATELEG
jgi:hypothetical protein